MRHNKGYFILLGFLLTIILFLSFLPNIKLGAILVFALEPEIQLGIEATLPAYVNYFFTFAIRLAVSLAVLVIIFGGIYWLVSFGMGKFTSEGKNWVKAGILGLAILLSSWLILHTINPDLISLDYFPLPLIPGLPVVPPGGPTGPTLPTMTYNEIPVGILTENLLSRTLDSCFDFDDKGEPINENSSTADIEPTLIDHDRADCLLKLGEAIKTKAKIATDLSREIATLMNQCKCDENSCDLPPCECSYNEICRYYGGSGTCQGSCMNIHCLRKGDCCPPDTKEQIEHGPVYLPTCNIDKALLAANCAAECVEEHPYEDPNQCLERCIEENSKEYKGLDEFRNPISDDQILGTVETVTTLPDGRKLVKIKKNVWDGLNLINKLIYLKEKIKKIQEDIEKDLNVLNKGEKELSQCILAKPYVDFLKFIETTNKTRLNISINENIKDPITDKTIDSAKYCKGFEYSSSQCFQTCQNQCPAMNEQNRNWFRNCPTCSDNDEDCLEDQKTCVTEGINNSSCLYGTSFDDFEHCLGSCRNDCLSRCEEEYTDECPDELRTCQNACYKNSESLIVNEDKCYFNFEGMIGCAKLKRCTGTLDTCETDDDCDILQLQVCEPISDKEFEECAKNTFLCKYSSDQHPGDPECLKKSPWDQYSSLYLYKHPDRQKQEECVQTEPVKRCASDKGRTDTECTNNSQCDTTAGETCEEFDLETPSEYWKCPACSSCSDCPLLDCDDKFTICQNACKRDKDLERPDYNEAECFDSCDWDYIDCIENDEKDIVDESLLTSSAQCRKYAYDDDPLTFYCFNTLNVPWLGTFEGWWFDTSEKNLTAIGREGTCSKSGEIPLGQTIDESEAWAQELLSESFSEKTDDMIKYIKRVGEQTNYCECDSVCDDGKGACGGTCSYWEIRVPVFDELGNIVGIEPNCGCRVEPCSGNPCQKMISLLIGGSCAENADGVDKYYQEVKTTLEELRKPIMEGRSEILKRLVYSRSQMDECSNIRTNFSADVRILSCKRVEDNLISPIREGEVIIDGRVLKNHCYGQEAGKVLKISKPMADNWFCCEKMVK